MPDLIDDILPSHRIHLLGGSSNAGKTRWVLPALLEWEKGRPIMGHPSHPVPWAYVVGDRLLVEAHDTMSKMGISPNAIRSIPAFGKDNKGIIQIMQAAADLTPTPELLVIEGFGDLVDHPGMKKQVREFLSQVAAYCYTRDFPNGLTVLGIVESPKLKPQERYKDPRQRISGVAAWGYHASTVMLIESDAPEDITTPDRNMYVSMKNAPSFKTTGAFNSAGSLIFP